MRSLSARSLLHGVYIFAKFVSGSLSGSLGCQFLTLIPVAQLVALVAASLGVGYTLGARSLPSGQVKTVPPQTEKTPEKPPLVESSEPEDEDSDEEAADGDLANIKAGLFEECKLVRDLLGLLTLQFKESVDRF